MSTWYAAGTVTVTSGSAAVTGSGTGWSGVVRAGDVLWVAGVSCRIASVNSGTSLTLARPWPGASASGAYYEVWLTPDEAVIQASLRDLLALLSGDNLTALSGLTTAADRLPYFSGPGAAALTNLTPAARAVLALVGSSGAKVPVVTGAGSAALRDLVGTVSQSGGLPAGALIEAGSNANGRYWRYAGGMQIAIRTDAEFLQANASAVVCSWTYPAPFAETPSCSASLYNASAALTDLTWQDIGAYRYGSGPSGTEHILARTAGAPNFSASAKITGVRLTAIGAWHP